MNNSVWWCIDAKGSWAFTFVKDGLSRRQANDLAAQLRKKSDRPSNAKVAVYSGDRLRGMV